METVCSFPKEIEKSWLKSKQLKPKGNQKEYDLIVLWSGLEPCHWGHQASVKR